MQSNDSFNSFFFSLAIDVGECNTHAAIYIRCR